MPSKTQTDSTKTRKKKKTLAFIKKISPKTKMKWLKIIKKYPRATSSLVLLRIIKPELRARTYNGERREAKGHERSHQRRDVYMKQIFWMCVHYRRSKTLEDGQRARAFLLNLYTLLRYNQPIKIQERSMTRTFGRRKY